MLVQLNAPLLLLSILASLYDPPITFAEALPSFAPVTASPVTVAPVTAVPVTAAPVTSMPVVPISDYRCGVDEEEARLNCGKLCTVNTDCETGAFCWGTFPNTCYANARPFASLAPIPSPPIPSHLQPRSDFRCGISEVDARSNCKSECTTAADCNEPGEFCWTTFESYCHMMPDDGHPVCDANVSEQIIRRCGYNEQAARSFCGKTCSNEVDCEDPGEKCFPVQLNLCECFAEQDEMINTASSEDAVQRQLDSTDETNAEYFERAKEPLVRYFAAEEDTTSLDTSTSSASARTCGFMGLLAIALWLFAII